MSLEQETQGGPPQFDQERGTEEKPAQLTSPTGTEEHHRSPHCCRDRRLVMGSLFTCCGCLSLLLVFVVLVSIIGHFQTAFTFQQTLRVSAHDSKLVTEIDTQLCSRLQLDNPSQGAAALFVLSEVLQPLNRYSFSFNEPSRLSPQSPNEVYFAHLNPRANVTFTVCKDDEDADWGQNAAAATLRLHAFNSYASYQDWVMHGRRTYVDSVEVVNLCSEGQPVTYRHSATSDNDWYYALRLDEGSLTIGFKPGMSLERLNYGVVVDHLLGSCLASRLLDAPNCTVPTVPGAQYLLLTGEAFDLAVATTVEVTCIAAGNVHLPALVVSSATVSFIAMVVFVGGICILSCFCYQGQLSRYGECGSTLPTCCSSHQQVKVRRGEYDYYDAEHLISQEINEENDLQDASAGLTSEVQD